ncbi:cytochrome P450 [Russula aff. rugulosa BPL654]|nr:cytochrome P450 [Russula aff. rugulosa BPL654]
MAAWPMVVDFLIVLSFICTLQAFRDYRRRRGLPYPPGPRPLPIIGNLLDIPMESSWLAYSQLAKKYGDVMSFHILGRVVVILGSTEATKNLLGKRGNVYSDRPVIPFFEMMDVQWSVLLARYGEHWRFRRKIVERSFRPGSLSAYRVIQETKARALATRLFQSPQEWISHIELFQGEQLLAMTYGYEAKGHHDKTIDAAKKLSDIGTRASLPGSFLVNEFPFLRHIPEWIPWISYWPLARIGHALAEQVMNDPMRFVRESMLSGTAPRSIAFDRLVEAEKLGNSEREGYERAITETLGTMYTDGFVNNVAVSRSFALSRGAEESTGRNRCCYRTRAFPDFEDRPRLPFVDALCREVLRWRPAAPLHVPHAATEDRVYNGLFIPKGAWLIGNIWAITRDPDVFPEPEVFKPERFLNPDGTLRDDVTLTSVFGFGKRVCPGRHYVDATLFIVAATVLSVFRIEKRRGSEGTPFNFTYSGSLVSRPNPFPCSISPRDKRAEELIISQTE